MFWLVWGGILIPILAVYFVLAIPVLLICMVGGLVDSLLQGHKARGSSGTKRSRQQRQQQVFPSKQTSRQPLVRKPQQAAQQEQAMRRAAQAEVDQFGVFADAVVEEFRGELNHLRRDDVAEER